MKEDLQLKMDAFLPLRDVVFNTLRDAILRGELKPGERLMEMHLAFYYSKDFLRVKTRKPELANCISEEFKKLNLKVHVKIYED